MNAHSRLATRTLLPLCGAAALLATATTTASPLAAAPAAAAAVPVGCSEVALSQAITIANGTGGTLTLSPGCTYTLTTPLPAISGTMTIDGNVATITRSNSAPEFGILRVASGGNLTIRRVFITNGAATASGDFGGAIHNEGTLSVGQSVIRDNRADFSGGIGGSSGTTTTITNTLISRNKAARNGGGVANDGTMTIAMSTLSDNTAVGQGGGVANDGTLKINQSVLLNNSVTGTDGLEGRGGGLANFGGAATTTLNRAIITGNRAAVTAGGVYNEAGTVASTLSVIAGNTPNNCVTSSPAVQQCTN
ncbi:hypothetical protein ACGFYU_36295 [Streptomyces sp. NPDC048337]|uniref:hypothetical protein n=1 Tax=Streptomyces sp. NPDC048337 TaxID=3365535 RepID=UPI003718D9E0